VRAQIWSSWLALTGDVPVFARPGKNGRGVEFINLKTGDPIGSDKQYRVVSGIVQFPPRDGEAGGKAVRNISVRQAGFGPTAVTVSATLWPSHADVKVDQGDVVTLEGSYTRTRPRSRTAPR
jgi:hypothetical protein